MSTIRLAEWEGKVLSVDTNNIHAFVGCPDLCSVWVYEWPELMNNSSPRPIQVIAGPPDSAFGSSMASTWLSDKLVVGAHRFNYMAGGVFVYEWYKVEKRYIQSQVLADTISPSGSIQGQGSSVAIAGQNGLTIVVGHMLSGEQTGGALQYLWDYTVGKFVMIPKSLLPRNVTEGALAGCAVACSARGDTVILGCAGDGEHGSASVFQ